jgi:hypothetical protein
MLAMVTFDVSELVAPMAWLTPSAPRFVTLAASALTAVSKLVLNCFSCKMLAC